MNASDVSSPVPRRRRIWRWLLAGFGLGLAVTALAAYNLVTLTRDAEKLRDELISSLPRSPRTQIQVTVGPLLLTTVRTAIGAFNCVPEEARLAMRAVRDASVGVYKLSESMGASERARIFSSADNVMQSRGWTRVVGVSDDENLVLVYLPAREQSGSTEQVCVAVCSRENLVVVEGRVRMDRLVDLAMQKGMVARR